LRLVVGVEAGRELMKALREARSRVWIASPFISCSVACKILPRDVDGRVVTLPDSEVVTSGCLSELGCYEVRVLEGLHAKMYLVDGRAFVGSANLTEGGLFRNFELLIEIYESEEMFSQLVNLFQVLWTMSTEPLYSKTRSVHSGDAHVRTYSGSGEVQGS